MPDTSTLDLTNWELLTEEDFNSMVFDSGVFVKNFDPSKFTTPSESDVLFSTGGDIGITHNTTKVNLGDGVNNIHFPYAELMVITGVDTAQITVSSFDFSPDGLKFALGAADVTEATGAVTPRYYIKSSDFTTNFAWIGVKKGGGLVAVVIPMALSTGGLSISAKKGDKGTSQLTIGAFRSISSKSTPEMPLVDGSLENPVIGTSVPAPACFASLWYRPKPVSSTLIPISITEVHIAASVRSRPLSVNRLVITCPSAHMLPPTPKATGIFTALLDFGEALLLILSYISGVIFINIHSFHGYCPRPEADYS